MPLCHAILGTRGRSARAGLALLRHAAAWVPVLMLWLAAPALAQSPPRAREETTRSENYTIKARIDRAEAERLRDELEAAHRAIVRTFPAYRIPAPVPMNVYIFAEREHFADFVSRQGFSAANASGIFFERNGRAGVTTYTQGQAESKVIETLRHEGFHLFAFLRIHRDLPMWIDEGLAEYFGASRRAGDELILGIAPPSAVENVRAAIEEDRLVPLADLMSSGASTWNRGVIRADPRVNLMYDESWSFVHFLLHHEGGKHAHRLRAYLDALHMNAGEKRARQAAFPKDELTRLESEWKDAMLAMPADPLLLAAERLDFLAAGCEALRRAGHRPGDLAELQRLLAESHFRHWTEAGSRVASLSSLNADTFTAPDGAELVYAPANDLEQGATLEVRGLSATVRIAWRVEQGGVLGHTVEYERRANP